MLLQSPEMHGFQSLPLPPEPSLPSKAPPRASSSRLRSERSFLRPPRPKAKDTESGSSDHLPASRRVSGGAADKPVRPRPRCCEEATLKASGRRLCWGEGGLGAGGRQWLVACGL